MNFSTNGNPVSGNSVTSTLATFVVLALTMPMSVWKKPVAPSAKCCVKGASTSVAIVSVSGAEVLAAWAASPL